jgi:hypothetical protein
LLAFVNLGFSGKMKNVFILIILWVVSLAQPSSGGTQTLTPLNSSDFEQVRYADQFFKTPLTPAGSISIGPNTVTINAIRGISTVSAPPGILGRYHVAHRLRIAGTGTPEVVKLTATTCTGADTGTCTITFTATGAHAKGFTIGSATAGFQEAIVDAYGQWGGTNPTTGWTVKGSPYPKNGQYVFYGTLNVDNISGSVGGNHLDCAGATLQDDVSNAPMIEIGGNIYGLPSKTLINNCHFAVYPGVGRAANGKQIYVLDIGQYTDLSHNDFDGYLNPTDFVDGLVQVSGDQGFVYEYNVANIPAMKCDATWCGVQLYGDGFHSASIGTVHDNLFNGADGINWISGNGLTLYGNVFQNWYRYPWRYRGGLTPVRDLGGNYYEGNGALINPDFGVAGYGVNTGRQIGTSGSVVQYSAGEDRGAQLGAHRFSSTGSNIYTYYIVGNKAGKSTRPLFIGDAATDGRLSFTVLFLKFNATTYDVLRTGPANHDGTDASPYGTGYWAVATGITCTVNPCSYRETFAAPTSYTIKAEIQATAYAPVMGSDFEYWPVPLFLNGGLTPSVYIGPSINGFVSMSPNSGYGTYYDAIFTSEPGGAGPITGQRILHMMPLEGGSGTNPGAWIINPDEQVQPMSNRKGRINMPSLSRTNNMYLRLHDNLLYQTFDSDPAKTFATAGHQPLLDTADCGMGYDRNASYLAFMCGNPISFYVNHKFDSGTSKVFQILSTGVLINKGLSQSSGNGYQAVRTVAGCATPASAGATCRTTVTWTSPFEDSNYTPHCDGLAITAGVPLNGGITGKVAASVTFQTVSATAAVAQFTNIVCSAFHD